MDVLEGGRKRCLLRMCGGVKQDPEWPVWAWQVCDLARLPRQLARATCSACLFSPLAYPLKISVPDRHIDDAHFLPELLLNSCGKSIWLNPRRSSCLTPTIYYSVRGSQCFRLAPTSVRTSLHIGILIDISGLNSIVLFLNGAFFFLRFFSALFFPWQG